MRVHHVRTHRSEENLSREEQLAWAMAEVATDPVEVTTSAAERIFTRFIDNAALRLPELAVDEVCLDVRRVAERCVPRYSKGSFLKKGMNVCCMQIGRLRKSGAPSGKGLLLGSCSVCLAL